MSTRVAACPRPCRMTRYCGESASQERCIGTTFIIWPRPAASWTPGSMKILLSPSRTPSWKRNWVRSGSFPQATVSGSWTVWSPIARTMDRPSFTRAPFHVAKTHTCSTDITRSRPARCSPSAATPGGCWQRRGSRNTFSSLATSPPTTGSTPIVVPPCPSSQQKTRVAEAVDVAEFDFVIQPALDSVTRRSDIESCAPRAR
mmetsp:Transcript_57703/g.153809  ORF Transcript_57703/g.153809 Transcript_57703/m.153809 type:complete len:202 (-) Transcript_57703:50-655(-)